MKTESVVSDKPQSAQAVLKRHLTQIPKCLFSRVFLYWLVKEPTKSRDKPAIGPPEN